MRFVSYTRTTSCYPGADIPSDVITAQNERIKNYAVKHGWKIENRYSDRKKSKEENTAFEKLLNDGIQRKFDAVIVDSIFRAGKDLWSAREVLLQTLHYAGIGFVVVEDDYISIGKSNAEAEAYFDKQYGILRSENIRHRVLHRNRSGVLSWNDAKYGYRLTDDYELVIDEETAPVVKRIFQMCADGMPIPKVAAVLSEEKIPSPLAMRGTNVKIDDPYKWTRLSVRRLLDKTVYIGHWSKVVQGEVIEFTNEPIISEELFREAQKVINSLYLTYLPKEKFKYAMKMNEDDRGSFTELVHTADCGQVSINISKPGITKGQHWHNSKWELFIVVHGHGLIQERNINTGEMVEFEVSGEKIEAVHMIPGWTHNIINLSDTEDLVTVMTCNEVFDPNRPDTFFEVV